MKHYHAQAGNGSKQINVKYFSGIGDFFCGKRHAANLLSLLACWIFILTQIEKGVKPIIAAEAFAFALFARFMPVFSGEREGLGINNGIGYAAL